MSVNGVVATLSTFAALSPEASAAAALSVPTSPFWYPTSTPRPETLLNSGRAVFETVHSEYLSLIQPARTRTSDRSAANCICSVPGSRSSAVCVITQNCVPAKGNSAAWRATSCCARDIARGASLASSLTRASRSCSAFSFASAAALFASAARASAEALPTLYSPAPAARAESKRLPPCAPLSATRVARTSRGIKIGSRYGAVSEPAGSGGGWGWAGLSPEH